MAQSVKRWSSRKLATATGWGIVWTALLWVGKLPPAIYETLMMISVGGYLAADVAEKRLVPPEHR